MGRGAAGECQRHALRTVTVLVPGVVPNLADRDLGVFLVDGVGEVETVLRRGVSLHRSFYDCVFEAVSVALVDDLAAGGHVIDGEIGEAVGLGGVGRAGDDGAVDLLAVAQQHDGYVGMHGARRGHPGLATADGGALLADGVGDVPAADRRGIAVDRLFLNRVEERLEGAVGHDNLAVDPDVIVGQVGEGVLGLAVAEGDFVNRLPVAVQHEGDVRVLGACRIHPGLAHKNAGVLLHNVGIQGVGDGEAVAVGVAADGGDVVVHRDLGDAVADGVQAEGVVYPGRGQSRECVLPAVAAAEHCIVDRVPVGEQLHGDGRRP